MFVSQHSQPPTQNLVELIQLCGGTVCKTVRQAGICIGKYSGRRPQGSRVLSEQWVLGEIIFYRLYINTKPFYQLVVLFLSNHLVSDSITHLKQLSYDDYMLE